MDSNTNQIKAVVFDLFETLITEAGVKQLSKSDVAERLGVEEEDFHREWSARFCGRHRGWYASYADVLVAISRTLGVEPSMRDISSLQDQRNKIKAMPYDRIEDTVLKALHGIRALGLKVGLISNCASEEVAAWPHSQLAPLFDVVDFSCETHHMKPEPEAYLLAAGASKCRLPKPCSSGMVVRMNSQAQPV